MEFGSLCLNLLLNFLHVISWPSFALLYPLYFSMRAIESKSCSKVQQCLACWVLFSIIGISECVLAGFLKWFKFWPHVKGILILLLLIPGFDVAPYIYQHVIRPYVHMDSLVCSLLFSPGKGDVFIWNENDYSDGVETCVVEDGAEESENCALVHRIPPPITSSRERVLPLPTDLRRAQMWSCVLCLVSATSEKCLKKHLKGKKHREKEAELRLIGMTAVRQFSTSNEMIMPDYHDGTPRISRENWRSLLSLIQWCTWRKPESGCTKLNTDGSVDKGNGRLGGLLRDENGEAICAYVSEVPSDNIFLVELWAVWRGLVLAVSLGIEVIWVESDSLSVVKTINRKQSYSPISTLYLRKIWEDLKKFKKYKVTHSWREANRAADYLSKMNLCGNDVVLQPAKFPPSLQIIIKEDAEGRRYRRV